MNTLPTELISKIARHLQQWNIIDLPFSHLTQTSEYGHDSWLEHTKASRQDICNFRLVCHRFRSASFSSFGELLGDRTFRLTKVGIEDLQAISAVASLQPYIRTLTFGGARFNSLSSYLGIQDMLAQVRESHQVHEWQEGNGGNDFQSQVAIVFTSLPNLQAIRFLLSDNADLRSQLSNWLAPGDEQFLDLAPSMLDSEDMDKLLVRDLFIFPPVMDAVRITGKSIQDIRFGLGPYYDLSWLHLSGSLHTSGMLANLRRLRMDIDPSYLCCNEGLPDDDLTGIFERLPHLTHITLMMAKRDKFTTFREATQNLVLLLNSVKSLEHLTLRGGWTFTEDETVDFVSTHSQSLTLFALKYTFLLAMGSWSSTVSRLVQLPLASMKYLELLMMRSICPDTRLVEAFTKRVHWEDFQACVNEVIENKAKFPVHFSSDYGVYIYDPSVGLRCY
jgi:hypothetical protein